MPPCKKQRYVYILVKATKDNFNSRALKRYIMSLLKQLNLFIFMAALMLYSSFAISKEIYINNLEWPPYFFSTPIPPELGFGKEIINICMKNTAYQPRYKTLPVMRTHLYMQTGDIDVSVYSYTNERNAYVYYGKEPIFSTSYALASKKDKNIVINNFSDLDNYTIGHLSGLTYTPEILKVINDKKKLQEVTTGYSFKALIRQMLAAPQRFEILLNSRETILWYANQLDITNKITVHDLFIADKNYYLTVSKFSQNILNPEQLLNQLDTCIQNLKINGEYKALALQYNL